MAKKVSNSLNMFNIYLTYKSLTILIRCPSYVLWQLIESSATVCVNVYTLVNFTMCDHLRWHGSHSAEVNENINLGYGQDQSFRVRVCFRAIMLFLILKRVLVTH